MNIYNKNWAQYEYSYNLANSRENWAPQTKKNSTGRAQRREDMTSRRSDNLDALITLQGQESRECKLQGWLCGQSHDGRSVFSTKLSRLASQNWL